MTQQAAGEATARVVARYHEALSAGMPLAGGRSLAEGPKALNEEWRFL